MLMYAFLAFFAAIAAMLTPHHDIIRSLDEGRYAAIASGLLSQHSVALRLCSNGGCTPGVVSTQGSGFGPPGATPGRFVSKWDGAALVTTWTPRPGEQTLPGMVNAAMRQQSRSFFVGPFRSATRTVGSPGPIFPGGAPRSVRVPDDLLAGLVDEYPIALACLKVECIDE